MPFLWCSWMKFELRVWRIKNISETPLFLRQHLSTLIVALRRERIDFLSVPLGLSIALIPILQFTRRLRSTYFCIYRHRCEYLSSEPNFLCLTIQFFWILKECIAKCRACFSNMAPSGGMPLGAPFSPFDHSFLLLSSILMIHIYFYSCTPWVSSFV